MVLKNNFYISILCIFSFISLKANSELFYTDKYDTNYFSSEIQKNTSINIGCNLFEFINAEQLQVCKSFIDSFLRTEKIEFESSFSFKNKNILELHLKNANAITCNKLSENWFEQYNIEWIKLLNSQIDVNSIKEGNPEIIILKKLFIDEQNRPFHVTNIVNKTLLAFIIPKSNTKNNFKKSKTVLNTKRYTSHEAELNFTEILYDSTLNVNEITYNFPSTSKQTFLKNQISYYILKEILPKQDILEVKYSLAQSFIKLKTKQISNEFQKNFVINESIKEIGKEQFKAIKLKAIQEMLLSINLKNLFYYSYYDILKLKQLEYLYKKEDLETVIKIFNEKTKYIVEISKNSNFEYKNSILEEFHYTDFIKEIPYKKNSIEFKNDNDTLLLKKIILFLHLNDNYNLAIKSFSKTNEYLFIDNDKKKEILDKYNEQNYTISYTFKLKLYRSLNLFNKLVELGIEPNRLNCVGQRDKKSIVIFHFFRKD